MITEKTDVQILDEFSNVTNWALINKLTINVSKTRERVFHRPIPRNYLPPVAIKDIERVSYAKLLGIWLQEDMGFTKHVDYMIHICNQRLYLLNQLRKQSLPQSELQSVFVAIVLSPLLYAAPAWTGYASTSIIESMQRVLVNDKRWRIVGK